jgi:hypothetical protein
MRFLLLSALLMLAPFGAFAQTTSSTDASNQASYFSSVIEIFFNVGLNLGILLSLVLLVLISWSYLMGLLNPNKVSQQNRTLVTLPKYIGGVVVVSFLYAPLNAIVAFNDLTGLVNESQNRTLCLLVDVTATNLKSDWQGDADTCLSKIKSQVSSLASYTSEDAIEFSRLDVWGGLVQLTSLFFFIGAAVQLWMKLYGIREVKMSYMACIIALIFSSAGMAIFNVVDYIEDIREGANEIVGD